jgi:hypothetical protein
MDNNFYRHSANGKKSHLRAAAGSGTSPGQKNHAMVRTKERYCEFPEKLSFHYDYSSRSRAGLVWGKT